MRFRFLHLVLIFIGLLSFSAKAQIYMQDLNRTHNRNNFYLELGGSAYYYSANYELLIAKTNTNSFALFGRAGIEYLPIRGADRTIHFPVAANVLIGKKRSMLEIGAGVLFRLEFSDGNVGGDGYYLTNPPTRIFFAPVIGYRFVSKPNEYGERFILRVSFTPLMGMSVFTNTPNFVPWGGISIGRSWQNHSKKKK